MKSRLKFAALAAVTVSIAGGIGSAVANTSLTEVVASEGPVQIAQTQIAQTFGTTPVNAEDFLVVAVPGGSLQPYKPFIVEQVRPEPDCFEVINDGSPPMEVNALWTTFDYTGTCRVQKDSNGYAVWIGGQDVGLQYNLRVEERNGELVMLAKPFRGPAITVGRSGGISSTGFTKINLNPGWYLTKRTFEGQIVSSHLVYLTNDSTVAQLLAAEGEVVTSPTPTPTPTPTPGTPQTPPFTDIQGDVYAAQIARAAELGITSGYQDGTFKPRNTISREEAVSLVMETITETAPASLQARLPQQVTGAPFPDVPANRWSALKIQQAKQLGIVAGDDTGRFRPADRLTRAELIAMVRQAALTVQEATGSANASLAPTQSPTSFSDISGHWAAPIITQLSAYCGIATPVNETGSSFAPNSNALRNYAVTTLVRLIECPAEERGV